MDAAVAPGRSVGGKYLLQRPLASGGMGEVWVATHATLGGELALKFLAAGSDHGEDPATAMARFRFEAQVAARLSRRTRHIVSVTDHGEEEGRAYLVMELVEGESLETLIERGRCSLELVTAVVVQIAKGLAHAHAEGVFHRDLKPANVLLGRDEDGGLLVKILDFGIAKTARSHRAPEGLEHETDVGIILGTPTYMSPEQARGLRSLDHRCDLWALAVIAYEALCGALPYDGETTNDHLVNVCSAEAVPIREFRDDLPPALDAFFARAFAKRVADRFADTTSFASAFYAAATSTVRVAEPSASREELTSLLPAYEPPKRRGLAPVLVGLAVVSLIALFFVLRAPAAREADAPAPIGSSAPPVAVAPIPDPAVSSAVASADPPKPLAPKMANKPTKVQPPPTTTTTPVVPTATTSAPAAAKPIDKGEIL